VSRITLSFLSQKALPDLHGRNPDGRPLLIWSAGCSTGEEPYTLAIVLTEWAIANPGFRFSVLATASRTLCWQRPRAACLPPKFCVRCRQAAAEVFHAQPDPDSKFLRVVPELRQHVAFRRLNFMDADFGLSQKVDAFFCRNVIIYFDRPTQERIMQNSPISFSPVDTFVGHSETLHNMDLPSSRSHLLSTGTGDART